MMYKHIHITQEVERMNCYMRYLESKWIKSITHYPGIVEINVVVMKKQREYAVGKIYTLYSLQLYLRSMQSFFKTFWRYTAYTTE